MTAKEDATLRMVLHDDAGVPRSDMPPTHSAVSIADFLGCLRSSSDAGFSFAEIGEVAMQGWAGQQSEREAITDTRHP
ncbi:MAG TPA: hypothetical protein VJ779_13220 [Acetobacteraceae bacterium]|nr:hypothetical protein [Acetobacteraceae bacterium]